MNRNGAKYWREALKENLEEIAREKGVRVTVKNGKFGRAWVEYKIEVSERIPEQGNIFGSRAAEDFSYLAETVGLHANMLGKRFNAMGKELQVVGLMPKRGEYPILVVDVNTDIVYKWTARAVTAALKG